MDFDTDLEFDTEAGPYPRENPKKDLTPHFVTTGILLACCTAGFLLARDMYKPATMTFTMSDTFTAAPSHPQPEPAPPPKPKTTPWGGFDASVVKRYETAAKEATAEWSKALGFHLSTPLVYYQEDSSGWGVCSHPQASACALIGTNIILTAEIPEKHAKDVFMHEIGHLLGVTHIDGDPTMKCCYNGDTDTPYNKLSPAAVAVAKAHHLWLRADFPLK